MATVVLCITLAAWIALLALRDETVASCNRYLSQISSGNTEYYDLPGSGPLGTDRGDCDASVRNLTIFGAFVVFVGNALQVRVKISYHHGNASTYPFGVSSILQRLSQPAHSGEQLNTLHLNLFHCKAASRSTSSTPDKTTTISSNPLISPHLHPILPIIIARSQNIKGNHTS